MTKHPGHVSQTNPTVALLASVGKQSILLEHDPCSHTNPTAAPLTTDGKLSLLLEHDTCSRMSKDSIVSEGTAWLSQRAPSDALTLSGKSSDPGSPNFNMLSDIALIEDNLSPVISTANKSRENSNTESETSHDVVRSSPQVSHSLDAVSTLVDEDNKMDVHNSPGSTASSSLFEDYGSPEFGTVKKSGNVNSTGSTAKRRWIESENNCSDDKELESIVEATNSMVNRPSISSPLKKKVLETIVDPNDGNASCDESNSVSKNSKESNVTTKQKSGNKKIKRKKVAGNENDVNFSEETKISAVDTDSCQESSKNLRKRKIKRKVEVCEEEQEVDGSSGVKRSKKDGKSRELTETENKPCRQLRTRIEKRQKLNKE